jgi:hypothetical protein
MECQAIVRSRSPFDGTIGGADQVLTTAEAARYLGFAIRTLQAWRVERKGPPYCRPSGAVRYLKGDLIHWLTSHRVSLEAEASLGTRVGG